MDLEFGMAHMLYMFDVGVRDITKMRTGAMLRDNPTVLYIPPTGEYSEPKEFELVCAFMVRN